MTTATPSQQPLAPTPPPTFTVLDLETTGRYAADARIVEWAAVVFTRSNHDSTWHTTPHHSRVDPGVAIPREATRIHGIGDVDVVSSPGPATSLPHLLAYLIASPLVVTYNGDEYDLPCLRAECWRWGLGERYEAAQLRRRHVDVMPWAATTSRLPQYRRGARTLSTMASLHGVEGEGVAHSAVVDATTTGRLMLALIDRGVMTAPWVG